VETTTVPVRLKGTITITRGIIHNKEAMVAPTWANSKVFNNREVMGDLR